MPIDQAGNARVVDVSVDVGALEVQLDPVPTIVSLSPSDNAEFVALDSSVTVVFDETIQAGTGNIELRLFDTQALVETFDSTAITAGLSTTTVTNDTLTLTPSTQL
ncbi:MAG: Ig-like domain-containing protein, partial [Limnobacter sp.]|nr:Ig-like domain-containing protein [Limnobacter sp.]